MKTNFLSASKTHPVSWWLLAISFVLSCSLTKELLVIASLLVISQVLVIIFHESPNWKKPVGFYLRLGAAILIIRVIFRIIFNLESDPVNPILNFPSIVIKISDSASLTLLGPISSLSLQAAFIDGLRLAAIVLSVGMANTLANPRRLLKSTPGALYEIATAISISVNLAPQLITSISRVRKARSLRGQSKGVKALPGIVIPVLEDTLDQSMSLAASMSARGFGRKGKQSAFALNSIRLSGLLAITCICLGVFCLLVTPATKVLDLSLILLGLFGAFLYLKMSSLGALKTKYRKQSLQAGDYVWVSVSGALLLLFTMGVFH